MWHWEDVDPRRSGSSGDLAKLFKNEGVKEPGVFAAQQLPADAVLMAREVIQNSWDAARELHGSFAADEELPEFRITFVFRDLVGADKELLVDHLGLVELRERAAAVGDRKKLGLSTENCLDHLDSDEPFRVLEISEQGTTGMYGPFSGAKSKLYLALVSIGVTLKEDGAGGSYGYGKAGLIRGSATRTVVAYTCFRPRADDPGVTRRLLGMSYWGEHELDSTSYTGFARFGDMVDEESVFPFVDGDADASATALGLGARDPNVIEQLGSTFLLIEPTVSPNALCDAIERNWWPAIEGQQFTAEIVTAEGDRLFPRPRKNPVLRSFIQSWDVATMPQDNAVPTQMAKKFQPAGSLELGRVGLVADPSDWSYPQGAVVDEDGTTSGQVNHRSLVALVRGPSMVVEYFDAGQAAPFVRGTFVASPDVDDLLRQTEPKAHDSWQTAQSEGIDAHAPAAASLILRRIKSTVNEFRKNLKPPTPRGPEIRLPLLEDLFKDLLKGDGKGTPPPPPGARDVHIKISKQDLEKAPGDADMIRLHAVVGFSLAQGLEDTTDLPVVLGIRFTFLEDQAAGERCELEINPPPGFTERPEHPGSFSGNLSSDEVVFDVVSEAYASDWSGRLVATGEVVKDELAAAWGSGPNE